MEKNNSAKRTIDANKILQANAELAKAHFNEIETEKKAISEELERGKRYLIEEVLYDGEQLLQEINEREKKKRSFWTKLIDFVFR